uniref:HTH CENPB-type domain-containing protein n=1 Tax=Latimeria chalumnae TaxID=7897 RepID=H3AM58_LATCH
TAAALIALKNKKMNEKKCKSLSIDTKYQIITAVDAGNKKKEDIASEFGVLPNTLEHKFKKQRKKLRGSEHKEVEDALHMWLKSARNDNIPLSGPILAAKAEKLAVDLGNEKFTIERFKKTPEYCEVNQSVVLAIKGKNCHGGKHCKKRITVMVAADMDSSEKLKLLIIGKNVKSLPVDHKANTRAWMTSNIFSEWVKKFDRKMECQKRKVLVFIDNCPVHPTVATLKVTTVIFLPTNSTSKLQPMDQGIIKLFKQNYRCLLLQHSIACFESWENAEINLLEAIQFAHRAWRKVTIRCISSCFAKAGFHISETNEETENPSSDKEGNIPLSELVVHMELSSDLTVEDYIDVDKNVIDSTQLTEADIIASIKTQDSASGDKEFESDEEYEPEELKLPSVAEVTHCIEVLNRFINAQSEVSDTIYNNIAELSDYILLRKAE